MNFNKTLLAALGLMLTTSAWAGGGTASVQIIHNCADAAASTVDIYLNGDLLLDDVDFRTASPFLPAPAGIPLTVGIAPGTSMSASESIYEQTFTLAADAKYIIVASGIVSPTGYDPAQPFTLAVYDMAEEASAGGTTTDLLVYHGSTDAPTVDVYESAVLNATAVDDISYGEFAGYLALPTNDHTIQVRDAANSTIVAAYSAPLSTLSLGGAAITVLASGFLNPAVNSNGPAFGLYVALASGGPLVPLPSAAIPSARVQVVHNSSDLAAASVDVWLNNTLLLDDFAFRTASPFVDAQAGVPFMVSIAAPTSTDTVGALAQYTYTLAEGGTYQIVASGIVSATGYSPAQPFNLAVYGMAEEASTGGANTTDVLVYHGSTDAPTVDVYESAVLNATAVDDIAYGEFAGYLQLPTDDYTLQVRDAANSTIVAAYAAPLSTLGLGGTAITVFASGFLNPAANSDGPAFGLYASLATGGPLVPLPSLAIPTARVQVVHNAADLAAASVDVWLNNTLLLDDFAFRTASPFVDAQAGVPFVVSISAPTSTDTVGAIAQYTYTLDEGGSYILVANGIVSATGYSPVQPFDIYVAGDAREVAADPMRTDILVFHGATDAPTVDVAETAVLGGTTLVDDLSYSEYAGYLEVPTDDYTLEVRTADGTPVASFDAPLATLGLEGQAITVFASGFLNPSDNSNGPAFGLWASLATGGPLVPLSNTTGVADIQKVADLVSLYPNPANNAAELVLQGAKSQRISLQIADVAGRMVKDLGTRDLGTNGNFVNVDVSSLAPGSYRLLISTTDAYTSLPLQVVR